MFLRLCLFEMKQWLKNLLFHCFVVFMIISIIMNFGSCEIAKEPALGDVTLGHWDSPSEDDKINHCLGRLVIEYQNNKFIVNKMGMYIEKALEKEQLLDINEQFYKITGQRIDDIVVPFEYLGDNAEALDVYKGIARYNNISILCDYITFCEEMDAIDGVIGGNSMYDEASRNAILTSASYEEEMQQYQSILYKDKISNAYARLFCDYAVVDLAILPIFLAVSRCLKGKNNKLEEIVYTKSTNSFNIITSRYISLVLLEILVMIVISIPYQAYYTIGGLELGVEVDFCAFLKMIMIWLLPTILIVNAVGFFVTEITNSALAVPLQIIWWFFDLKAGTESLIGRFSYHLMPRFNTVGRREIFDMYYEELLKNRYTYLIISFLLVMATIVVYRKRRTGRWKPELMWKFQKEI